MPFRRKRLAGNVQTSRTMRSFDCVLANESILRRVYVFCSNEGYLFLAGITKAFHIMLLASRDPESVKRTSFAAAAASVARVAWSTVEDSGLAWDLPLLKAAAKSACGAAVLQFALDEGYICNDSSFWRYGSASLSDWSAEAGQLDTLMWARRNGRPWGANVCSGAAGGGHLGVLQYARANGCPWDGDCTNRAAGGAHLEVLKWARANGCPWGAYTAAAAAENGHLEVLQWVRANGCPWGAVTTSGAAAHGRLSILQWLRSQDCPWDESTCYRAALGGHLEVLQWARANSCPWDATTCCGAIQGAAARGIAAGEDRCVRWVHENGCPCAINHVLFFA
ncbi:unnamed protein product [Phaeothamnion confervicola]